MSAKGRLTDPGPLGWFILGTVAAWIINKTLDRLYSITGRLKFSHAVGVAAVVLGATISGGATAILVVLVPLLIPVVSTAMNQGSLAYRLENAYSFGFFIFIFSLGAYLGILMFGGGIWALFPRSRAAKFVKRRLFRIKKKREVLAHYFVGQGSMGLFHSRAPLKQ